ncbi:MAG: rhomboid family intramembrane serine protease [Longimicrobiales bacterium]
MYGVEDDPLQDLIDETAMAYTDRGYGFGFGGMLTPMVKRLLIANVAVFGVTLLVGFDFVLDWFAFQPTRIFVRPWGVATYMFIHGGFMHLALNMLVLFFFGPPLESRWGSREFLKFYLICGLGGVALSYLFLPAAVVGASAAVYGLMLAFAMNWPEAPIYVWGIFPVKAKWLVGFLFVVSLMSALSDPGGGGGVAHFAHLGGLAAGFAYLKSDWRPGSRSATTSGTKRPARRRLAIVPREEREARRAEKTETRRREDEKVLLDRVDAVLDKISAEGMSSLTPEELRLLDEVSKRRRSN